MGYGMGFKPAEKPMSKAERCAGVVEAFMGGDDECISCELESQKEAVAMQKAMSAAARKAGARCFRDGCAVYLVKG